MLFGAQKNKGKKIETGMQYGHGHAACIMYWDMLLEVNVQHGHGNGTLTWTCSMKMNMQHGHVYSIWTWT
jgi:hypothetical protein